MDTSLNIHRKVWAHKKHGVWGLLQLLVTSQRNREGNTLTPTQKSATARETMNALVLVRSCRLLLTRKTIYPFPLMVRIERNQPSTQNHSCSAMLLIWLVSKKPFFSGDTRWLTKQFSHLYKPSHCQLVLR